MAAASERGDAAGCGDRSVSLTFHATQSVRSWGRVVRRSQQAARPELVSDLVDWAAGDKGARLAAGLGRSYGDSGLFSDGRLVLTSRLDRLISFDGAGLLRAQAGLSLGALLAFAVPHGWFLPVTPGTKHVTLGGALANDVHGKNHSHAGTFGRHVRGFTLLRSDRGVVEVTPASEPDLFAATIGGLGLTGIVLDVTLQLSPITSASLDVERLPVGDLDELFALNSASLPLYEQTVVWIDGARRGPSTGLGVYERANWAKAGGLSVHDARSVSMSVQAPRFALNALAVGTFNRAYRAIQLRHRQISQMHYSRLFYRLDVVEDWNKLYGRAGFFQYHCVVPLNHGRDAVAEMLDTVSRSSECSPLVVLKTFGDLGSPGMLSFPREGYTLALDFMNRGPATLSLLARLDDIVRSAGGALYPAKDGRMPRSMFEFSYPQLERFLSLRDPACGSDFAQRMAL